MRSKHLKHAANITMEGKIEKFSLRTRRRQGHTLVSFHSVQFQPGTLGKGKKYQTSKGRNKKVALFLFSYCIIIPNNPHIHVVELN